MKRYCLLTIMFLSTFNLFGDWIKKDTHFELSENVGLFRDIKIFDKENLVRIINSENKIFEIDYDSGKIRNILKLENLPLINSDAKISSDGKTTLISNIEFINKKQSLQISLIDNSNGKILCNYTKYDSYYNISILKVPYFIYNFSSNELTIFINYYYEYRAGSTNYITDTGVILFGSIQDGKFEIANTIDHIGTNFVMAEREAESLLISTYNRGSSLGSFSWNESSRNQLVRFNLINKNIDTILKYNYTHDSYWGMDNSYVKYEGIDAHINSIFESTDKNIVFLNINKNLIKFDLKNNSVIDSVDKVFTSDYDIVSPEFNYIYMVNKDKLQVKPTHSPQIIYEFKTDTSIVSQSLNADFENKIVLLSDLKGRLIKLKPATMEDIDSIGFYWNRDWLYEGMQVDFYALNNLSNCTFSWSINDSLFQKTNKKKYSYIFHNPGLYSVTLMITLADGKQLTFLKKDIINVLEKLEPEFDFEILNDTLPLRVKLIDKTKSNYKTKEWILESNSGKFNNIEKDIYEFVHPGVFSITLKISDGYTSAILTKYDTICIESIKPTVVEKTELLNHKRYKAAFGDAFFGSTGIYYYYLDLNTISNGYPGVDIYVGNYHFKNNLLDTSQFRSTFLNHPYKHPYCISNYAKDKLIVFADNDFANVSIWDFKIKKYYLVKNMPSLSLTTASKLTKDNKLFSASRFNISLSNSDSSLSLVTSYKFPNLSYKNVFLDTTNDALHVVGQVDDSTYDYLSYTNDISLKYSKRFKLSNKITINNIKTINDKNLIIYGYFSEGTYEKRFGMMIKYNPYSNIISENIVYNKRSIKKVISLGNKYFAAIGVNSGKQGYLLLDTNLSIVKDIRIDSLLGEIVGILSDNNNVYLFTDQIVYKETMVLGAIDGINMKVTVSDLPEEVILNIKEQKELTPIENKFSIFPNPATDYITINIGNNGACSNDIWASPNASVEIYDVMGIRIQSINLTPALTEGEGGRIDVSNLAPGVYFVKIVGNNGACSIVEKFVKY